MAARDPPVSGMYLLGHLGLGLLAGAGMLALRPGRRTAVAAGASVAFATAPDVDVYLAAIAHRGLTHTVWAAVGLGLGLAVLAGAAGRRRGGRRAATVVPGFVGGVVAGLTHLVGDVLTPMGIRPFHPVVGTTYSLELVAAENPEANLALLCAGCLAAALVLARERAAWAPTVRARLRAERGATEADIDRPA